MDEQSDGINVTPDEIKNIPSLDFSKKQFLEKYMNLFVPTCLTGLRFSDISQIQPTIIRKHMLCKKQ